MTYGEVCEKDFKNGAKEGQIMLLEEILKDTVNTNANFRLKYSQMLQELKDSLS